MNVTQMRIVYFTQKCLTISYKDIHTKVYFPVLHASPAHLHKFEA